ncbi:hypothetical protein DFJ77DRAFT_523773 [Powellomyces hirtus]|nr:hypothetical protein DFJ77DRAFT_523773 [Powellomyces hirtus]
MGSVWDFWNLTLIAVVCSAEELQADVLVGTGGGLMRRQILAWRVPPVKSVVNQMAGGWQPDPAPVERAAACPFVVGAGVGEATVLFAAARASSPLYADGVNLPRLWVAQKIVLYPFVVTNATRRKYATKVYNILVSIQVARTAGSKQPIEVRLVLKKAVAEAFGQVVY